MRHSLKDLQRARVLAAGGTGFIGRRLVTFLDSCGAQKIIVLARHIPDKSEFQRYGWSENVRLVRCDLSRPQSAAAIKKLGDFDYVFNLTGLTDQRMPHPDPLSLFLKNTAPLIHLTCGLRWEKVKGAVYIGSNAEYGAAPLPHCETRELLPTNMYGWSKAAASLWALAVTHAGLAKWCVARPFFVYGPDQRQGLAVELFRTLSKGKTLTLSSSSITRDPVFVDDAAEGMIRLALAEKAQGEIVNISNGKEITLAKIAQSVRAVIGRGRIENGSAPRPGDFLRSCGTTEKLFRLTGFQPQTPLAKGLEIMYQADYAP